MFPSVFDPVPELPLGPHLGAVYVDVVPNLTIVGALQTQLFPKMEPWRGWVRPDKPYKGGPRVALSVPTPPLPRPGFDFRECFSPIMTVERIWGPLWAPVGRASFCLLIIAAAFSFKFDKPQVRNQLKLTRRGE